MIIYIYIYIAFDFHFYQSLGSDTDFYDSLLNVTTTDARLPQLTKGKVHTLASEKYNGPLPFATKFPRKPYSQIVYVSYNHPRRIYCVLWAKILSNIVHLQIVVCSSAETS